MISANKFLAGWGIALFVCGYALVTYPGASTPAKQIEGNIFDQFDPTPHTTEIQGRARAVDGDTVDVNGLRVRLKGVDAPEWWHPYGPEAKRTLQQIIGNGAHLKCKLTGELTHGRQVGWCYNLLGDDIGAQIILVGKALACPHYDPRYVALEQPSAITRLPRSAYCFKK
jgi:endonuclease YncB( thermonuclease family)